MTEINKKDLSDICNSSFSRFCIQIKWQML